MPRFLGLPVGYLAQTVVAGRQYGLYTVNGVGGFDPALPTYDYQHEGTVAIGELATLVSQHLHLPHQAHPKLHTHNVTRSSTASPPQTTSKAPSS